MHWAQLDAERGGPPSFRWSQGSPEFKSRSLASLWLRPGTSTCHFLCIFLVKASPRAGDYTRWCIPADLVYLCGSHRLPQSMSPNLQYLLSPQPMAASPSPASILVLVSNMSTPLWIETVLNFKPLSGGLTPHLDLSNPVLPGSSSCGQTEPLDHFVHRCLS